MESFFTIPFPEFDSIKSPVADSWSESPRTTTKERAVAVDGGRDGARIPRIGLIPLNFYCMLYVQWSNDIPFQWLYSRFIAAYRWQLRTKHHRREDREQNRLEHQKDLKHSSLLHIKKTKVYQTVAPLIKNGASSPYFQTIRCKATLKQSPTTYKLIKSQRDVLQKNDKCASKTTLSKALFHCTAACRIVSNLAATPLVNPSTTRVTFTWLPSGQRISPIIPIPPIIFSLFVRYE